VLEKGKPDDVPTGIKGMRVRFIVKSLVLLTHYQQTFSSMPCNDITQICTKCLKFVLLP